MSRALSLAGFQVTLIGRIWVTPEELFYRFPVALKHALIQQDKRGFAFGYKSRAQNLVDPPVEIPLKKLDCPIFLLWSLRYASLQRSKALCVLLAQKEVPQPWRADLQHQPCTPGIFHA